VIIYVGPGKEEFKLSKSLLCHLSPFFRAAFEGEFKEGQEQTMELLDDDVDAFNHVVSYIYRGIFGGEKLHQHQFAGVRPATKLPTVIHLLELSERLQIPDMKVAALAELVWALRNNDSTKPTAEDVELAYNLLPTESEAVTHLVEYVADDFLKHETTFNVDSFKDWKFGRLTSDIEGFDVAFMVSLKRLTVGRLEREHGYDAECCCRRHWWSGAPHHHSQFCPFTSWRVTTGGW
jgi:hypothetical protein